MNTTNIYADIATRTQGDIYIGHGQSVGINLQLKIRLYVLYWRRIFYWDEVYFYSDFSIEMSKLSYTLNNSDEGDCSI